ncbi:MAG: AtpZ/AtpI family protein [Chloroflexota bacterium]|nr:MAG: AtpZ/AtpI family protein [Chloroflexota bacterium]
MSQTGSSPDKKSALRKLNLTLAAVTGQVGCLTVIIILVAFLAGRWLDSRFESDALFTVILMVASVPVTLVVMFWVVRSVTSRFAKPSAQNSLEDEEGRDSGKTP